MDLALFRDQTKPESLRICWTLGHVHPIDDHFDVEIDGPPWEYTELERRSPGALPGESHRHCCPMTSVLRRDLPTPGIGWSPHQTPTRLTDRWLRIIHALPPQHVWGGCGHERWCFFFAMTDIQTMKSFRDVRFISSESTHSFELGSAFL